jgi:hypothetical protein
VVDQDGLDHRPWERCAAACYGLSWQGVSLGDDQGTRSNRADGSRTR